MRADVNKLGVIIHINLSVLCALHGKTMGDIARIAGIKSHNTLSSRKDKPGNWTLGQLVHIAAYFNRPVEWLLADHTKEELA
nr:MAG TPA: LAMBDA REPRESSOR (TRIPLE MUTANT)/DNA COMPLEX-DNA COMPLEX, DOUBLE HELIX, TRANSCRIPTION-DNA.1A [Caudoviricetes sp.]